VALLLNAVRSDPIRRSATGGVLAVPSAGDETVAALDSILRDPQNASDIQDRPSSRSRSTIAVARVRILRAYAERA